MKEIIYTSSYDNNNPWCVKVDFQYSNNSTIDIDNEYFKIEIKDIFENYIQRNSLYKLEQAFSLDTKPTLSISNNEITGFKTIGTSPCEGSNIVIPQYASNLNTYRNSDFQNLIINGIQYWVDDNVFHLRLVAKGQSSLNPTGYKKIKNNELINTNYVGFCIALINLTLAEHDTISLQVNLLPRMLKGEVYKLNFDDKDYQIESKPYIDCPACGGAGYIGDTTNNCPHCNNKQATVSRVEYNFNNDDNYKDNLFVNNNEQTYSSYINNKLNTKTNKYQIYTTTALNEAKQTPLYGVYTSSFIPEYLVSEEIEDILKPGTSAARNFHYIEDTVSSYLYTSDEKYTEIPYTSAKYSIKNYTLIEDQDEKITTDMECTLINQTISSNSLEVTKNKIYFGMEV